MDFRYHNLKVSDNALHSKLYHYNVALYHYNVALYCVLNILSFTIYMFW